MHGTGHRGSRWGHEKQWRVFLPNIDAQQGKAGCDWWGEMSSILLMGR